MTINPHNQRRRARRWLVLLVLIAVAAAGSLSAALASPSGPLTGLRVAASGLALIGATGLAARVLIALDRRPASREQDRATKP